MSEIKILIAEGEHRMQDFKFRVDDQRKIARTISAFANTVGGRILVGIKDNGKIVGCNPEEEFFIIQSAADNFCKPPINIRSFIWQEEMKLILEVDVPPSSDRPHKSPDTEGNWKSYVRINDMTLTGNKITEGVWRMQKHEVRRPDTFGEDQLAVLRAVGTYEPITLSKLYRSIPMTKRKIDKILVMLIGWNLVVQEFNLTSIQYRLCDPLEE